MIVEATCNLFKGSTYTYKDGHLLYLSREMKVEEMSKMVFDLPTMKQQDTYLCPRTLLMIWNQTLFKVFKKYKMYSLVIWSCECEWILVHGTAVSQVAESETVSPKAQIKMMKKILTCKYFGCPLAIIGRDVSLYTFENNKF